MRSFVERETPERATAVPADARPFLVGRRARKAASTSSSRHCSLRRTPLGNDTHAACQSVPSGATTLSFGRWCRHRSGADPARVTVGHESSRVFSCLSALSGLNIQPVAEFGLSVCPAHQRKRADHPVIQRFFDNGAEELVLEPTPSYGDAGFKVFTTGCTAPPRGPSSPPTPRRGRATS